MHQIAVRPKADKLIADSYVNTKSHFLGIEPENEAIKAKKLGPHVKEQGPFSSYDVRISTNF
jgi:hypothetical protein